MFAPVAALLLVHTVRRALNPMWTYWFGQWLFTWDAGFIKRGLLGTLIHPLLSARGPDEIHLIVNLLAMTIFTLLCCVLCVVALRVHSYANRTPGGWCLTLVALAALSSSGVALAASTFGSLDHVLFLLMVGGVELARGGRLLLANLVAVAALAVHELFAVYGLPVVVLAVLLRGRIRARDLAWFALPLGFLGFLVEAQGRLSAAQLGVVRGQVSALKVLDPLWLDNAMVHLEVGFAANLAHHRARLVERALDPDILATALPTVLLLMLSAWIALSAGKRRRLCPLLPLVILSPMLAHLFGGDAPRFTNLCILQGFVTLYAIVSVAPAPLPPERALPTAMLACVATAINLCTPMSLMPNQRDGGGLFSAPDPRAP